MNKRLDPLFFDMAKDLTDAGLMDVQTMRKFDKMCLPEVDEYDAAGIKAIREKARVSQAVFAAYLNTSPSTVRQWEQGGAFLALAPTARNTLLEQMSDAFDIFVHPRSIPVVSQDLRRVMRSLLEDQFNHVHVFAYTELPGNVEIQALGRFELPVELLGSD